MASYNPFGIVEQLSEAERAQYDALDKTPPPEILAKQWRQAATVGWVKRYVDTHATWCPASRMLRKIGAATLVLLGIVLCLNIGGAIWAKALFRAAVREVLVEQGVIHAAIPAKSIVVEAMR